MEKILRRMKSNVVVSSILCLVLGLVLLLWPGLTMRIVCTTVGAVLIVSGVVRMIAYFTARDGSMYSQLNLVFGIILAAVGVWIVMSPEKVLALIPIIMGIIIALHGLHNIRQAILLSRDKYNNWWVALLLGILTVGFGVLLVCRPFAAVDTMVMLIGIFLIYDGLSSIWIVTRISKAAKILRQEMTAVEVEAEDVEE